MNFYSMGESMLRTFVMIYVIFIFGAIIIGIANYVLMSIGMYQMGKRRGKENPWMAFIPFARKYFQGSLAGNVKLGKKTLEKPAFWMVLLPVVKSGMMAVGYFVIWGSAILYSIRHYGGYYSGSNVMGGVPVVLVVLTAIVSTVIVIAINILRVIVNNKVYSYGLPKETALFHAVAGGFIPLYEAVCYFIFRDSGEDHSPETGYRRWDTNSRGEWSGSQQGSSAYRFDQSEPVYTKAPDPVSEPASTPVSQPQKPAEPMTPPEEPEQEPAIIYVEPKQETEPSAENENDEKLS